MAGYAKNVVARFEPHRIDKTPTKNVLKIAPAELAAAIQESSWCDNGPVFRGVSSDKSVNEAGENLFNKNSCQKMKQRFNRDEKNFQ